MKRFSRHEHRLPQYGLRCLRVERVEIRKTDPADFGWGGKSVFPLQPNVVLGGIEWGVGRTHTSFFKIRFMLSAKLKQRVSCVVYASCNTQPWIFSHLQKSFASVQATSSLNTS